MTNWRYLSNGKKNCPICKNPLIWWHWCSECTKYCTCPVPKHCRIVPAECIVLQVHKTKLPHFEDRLKEKECDDLYYEILYEHDDPPIVADSFSKEIVPNKRWRFLTNGKRCCRACKKAAAKNKCLCPTCIPTGSIPCECPIPEHSEPILDDHFVVFVNEAGRQAILELSATYDLAVIFPEDEAEGAEEQPKDSHECKKGKNKAKKGPKNSQECEKEKDKAEEGPKNSQECEKGKEKPEEVSKDSQACENEDGVASVQARLAALRSI